MRDLKLRYLLLVLPPSLVLLLASLLLNAFGYPVASYADLSGLNGAAEAGARVRVLATWLLLALLGVGSAAYFLWQLRDFGRRTILTLLAAYVALVAVGLGFSVAGKLEAHRYIGEDFACASFTALEQVKEGALPPAQKSDPPQPPQKGRASQAKAGATETPKQSPHLKEETDRQTATESCAGSDLWSAMSWLNAVQRYLLPLVTAALLLGMIGTLARPGGLNWGQRAERLNTFLYLSAAVLVAGLLLLSALLRWPGFALPKDPRAIFEGHASALVLYWGVAYSAYIALAYLPVAWFLKRDPDRAADAAADARNGAPEPLLTPLGMLKTAAAIFSPVIAALLAGVMDVGF